MLPNSLNELAVSYLFVSSCVCVCVCKLQGLRFQFTRGPVCNPSLTLNIKSLKLHWSNPNHLSLAFQKYRQKDFQGHYILQHAVA